MHPSVHSPAAAVLVPMEAGQHLLIRREQLTYLPAVIHVRALLTHRWKRHVATLSGAADWCVVQLLMAEDQLGLAPVGAQQRL
jgi:hypothetical protein